MAVNPQVQQYADAQTAFNTAISADIDDIVTKTTALNALIAQLQQTPPALTTEDQALLDQIEAAGKALQAKVDAADGKTPPPVPVVDPNNPNPTPTPAQTAAQAAATRSR